MKIRFIGGPAEDKENVISTTRDLDFEYVKYLPEYFNIPLPLDEAVPVFIEKRTQQPERLVFPKAVYRLERIAYRVGPDHREIIEHCYLWVD